MDFAFLLGAVIKGGAWSGPQGLQWGSTGTDGESASSPATPHTHPLEGPLEHTLEGWDLCVSLPCLREVSPDQCLQLLRFPSTSISRCVLAWRLAYTDTQASPGRSGCHMIPVSTHGVPALKLPPRSLSPPTPALGLPVCLVSHTPQSMEHEQLSRSGRLQGKALEAQDVDPLACPEG